MLARNLLWVLLGFAAEDRGRGSVGVMLEVQLDRLIAKDKTEAAL